MKAGDPTSWRIRVNALILLAIIAGTAVRHDVAAETTNIQAEIQESGDVRLWETSHPGSTFDESLSNLAFAWGGMQWWLEPIMTMLPLVLNSEDGTSELDIEAVDRLLADMPSSYSHTLVSAFPLIQIVDDDGTIETRATPRGTTEQLHRWYVRLGVLRDADTMFRQTDPVNLRLLQRWLRGAQQMAAAHEEEFYAAHPTFRETNLVAAFRSRTIEDVMQHVVVGAKLYDAGALLGTIGQVPDWIMHDPLGTPFTGGGTSQPLGESDLPLVPLGKPLGASNGAAFTYRPAEQPSVRKCVTVGEPHQPSHEQDVVGPAARPKIFQIYPRNNSGSFQPLLFMTQGGSATPMLNYSAFHGTSGTAGPSFGALIFHANTDGTRYQDEGGNWQSFDAQTVKYRWQGVERSYTQFSIPEFGEVFARIRRPGTDQQFVLLQRPKSVVSMVNGMFDRLRAGAQNDAHKYLETLRSGALTYWGEAGCHPTDPQQFPNEHGRAYFALNQGRTDMLSEEAEASLSQPIPISYAFRKKGTHDTALCSEQLWASSDNGSLKGGCPGELSFSQLRDPGFPTYRQVQFREWSAAHVESGEPLSRDELLRFATSTQSYSIRRIARLFAFAIEQFGASSIPPEKLPVAQLIGAAFGAHDGYRRDDLIQIALFHVASNFSENLYSPAFPDLAPVRPGITDPRISETELLAAVTPTVANALNQFIVQAIDFYLTKCQPQGITTWSQLVRVVADGKEVASRFAGPSEEARNSGALRFESQNGEQACSVRLHTTSPFSFIAFDDQIYYRTFGPPVSPHTLETGLYEKASAISWDLIGKINRAGAGSSTEEAYRSFSFHSSPTDAPSSPIFRSYTFALETASPDSVKQALQLVSKRLRQLAAAVTERQRRSRQASARRAIRAARAVLRLYRVTSLRLATLDSVERRSLKALASASTALKKPTSGAIPRALRQLKTARRMEF